MKKVTKKERKRANGMNAATQAHYETGFRPVEYVNVFAASPNLRPYYKKVSNGVPYVDNFNFM